MKKIWLCSVFSVLVVFSSSTVIARDFLTVQSRGKSSAAYSEKWGLPLQKGQLIVTESSQPINIVYLLLYPKYSPFVHVGILDSDGEDFYVYEASGTYKLGFNGKPPTDNVSGYVRRITLDEYLEETGGTASFYQVPANININEVQRYAESRVKAKTAFDPYFDHLDHSRLYCSEFVATALEAGGALPYQTVPMKLNKSLQVVINWLKVLDRNILPVYRLVSAENWVGTISRDYTLTELKVDRAVKAEIYQRFTSDQKVGSILSWGMGDVSFQPSIEKFREEAFAAFDKEKTYQVDAIISKVNELADIYLGHFDIKVVSECDIDFSLCH